MKGLAVEDERTRQAEAEPESERQNSRASLLGSEPAIFVGMLLSLALFYVVPLLPLRMVGLLVFFALTLYRPQLHLAMVPLAAPLFYRQQPLVGNSLFFPLAEVVVWVGVLAWAARDGWTLLTHLRSGRIRRRSQHPTPNTRHLIPNLKWEIWLALALALIGVLWLFVVQGGEDRRLALRELRWTIIAPLLFFAMMLRWLRTEGDIWRMVGAWLVGAALVGREGVEQFLYGETWRMEGVGRVSSVYPSATSFGIYLGRPLALGVILAFFLPAGWRTWRVAAAALSLVMSLGLLFSFARGAWVGVFAGLLVVGVLTRGRPLLVSLGGLMLAGLAALPFINVERITSIFNFNTQDNTGVARAKIWGAALRIIADHPLTGIGQDQFLRQDPRYEVPQNRFFLTSHPHNWVLDFWLRLGLPGLLWMVAALALFFWQALQLWQRQKGTALGALVLGLIASMVDFAVHGLLDMAYFTMDLALTFWLTVGLLTLVRRRTEDEGQAAEPALRESNVPQ